MSGQQSGVSHYTSQSEEDMAYLQLHIGTKSQAIWCIKQQVQILPCHIILYAADPCNWWR